MPLSSMRRLCRITSRHSSTRVDAISGSRSEDCSRARFRSRISTSTGSSPCPCIRAGSVPGPSTRPTKSPWGLVAVFGRPLVPGCLRIVDTPPQTELDQTDRHRFARNAFAVRASLTGKRVAIVDDVITTGATVNALARSLRSAGAEHIQAWAVARSIGSSADDSQPKRRM